MVREFYAHAKERDGDYVFMCGKRVPSSYTTINQFFRLNDLETLKYNLVISKMFDA